MKRQIECAAWLGKLIRKRQLRHRGGTTIAELLVACTLLGTLMASATQIIVRNGRLQNELARERLALDELTNQLEELQLLEPDQLEQALSQLQVSELVAQRLPQVQLNGELMVRDAARQVTLELRWRDTGRVETPLRLTTWVYPKGEVR